MAEEVREAPAFACCSVGIGRWFWVAWESEADARDSAKPLASGYEKSGALAEKRAAERLGAQVRRLPARWASGYLRGGTATAGEGHADRPGSRSKRPAAGPGRESGNARLAFLYSSVVREPPDPCEQVAMNRHRIVKQTAGKIYVERDPYEEDARAGGEPPDPEAKPRSVAVDRAALRKDGRIRASRAHGGLTFYSSEEAGVRDVEAALVARYPWSAVLGLRLPSTYDDVKAAYRRLAFATHPDRGGDAAEFRSVEQAYRAALACFSEVVGPTS